MKITLVGMGSGAPGSLTAAGLAALRGAERIIGARRLVENLPEGCTANRAALYKTDEICALLRQADCAETAVVFSGDTGFYSGAAALARALDAAAYPACNYWPRRWAARGRTGGSSPPTAVPVTRWPPAARAERPFS